MILNKNNFTYRGIIAIYTHKQLVVLESHLFQDKFKAHELNWALRILENQWRTFDGGPSHRCPNYFKCLLEPPTLPKKYFPHPDLFFWLKYRIGKCARFILLMVIWKILLGLGLFFYLTIKLVWQISNTDLISF